jgi:hypothetical protein
MHPKCHAALRVLVGGLAAMLFVVTMNAQGQPSPGVPASEKNHFIETPKGWVHPTTPWGEPDIQGMYNFSYVGSVPLERCGGGGSGRAPADVVAAAQPAGAGGQAGGGRGGGGRAGGRGGRGGRGGAPCDPMVAFRPEDDHKAALQRAAGAVDEHQRLLETGDLGGALQAGVMDPTTPQRQTSLIMDPPDGRLPAMTPEGVRLSREMKSSWTWFDSETLHWEGPEDFDTWDRCITRGMPASMFPYRYNNGMEIIQSPGYVVLNMEMVHEARVIPTDTRPPIASSITQWLGESRGRWEGRTLVVETTNFKAGASATNIGVAGSPQGNRFPTSGQMKITERITRLNDDHILYEITTEDPVVLTRPWTGRFPLKNDRTYQWWEYACHEGNRTIPDFVNASRAERAAQAAQPAAGEPAAPAGGRGAGGRGRGAGPGGP